MGADAHPTASAPMEESWKLQQRFTSADLLTLGQTEEMEACPTLETDRPVGAPLASAPTPRWPSSTRSSSSEAPHPVVTSDQSACTSSTSGAPTRRESLIGPFGHPTISSRCWPTSPGSFGPARSRPRRDPTGRATPGPRSYPKIEDAEMAVFLGLSFL